MTGVMTLYRSSIGKKAIMAVTGFILVGFVFIHMIGNLKMYFGAEDYNAYAEFLRNVGYPLFPHEGLLWIFRLVLITSVVLHIMSATQLTLMSQASRPQDYGNKDVVQPLYVYASRTMRWGGVIIALFITYHLLHFTTGTLHNSFIPGDVYHNVVMGFRVWWVSLFYMLAMLPLGLHLMHGIWSMFQTLGFNNSRYTRFLRTVALAVTGAIVLGNISFPLAVLMGIVAK